MWYTFRQWRLACVGRERKLQITVLQSFRVVTPTAETSSGRKGSRKPSDGHISDSDSKSDEPKDQYTGGGDADAGPNQVEQPPGIQPHCDSVNDLGLILRGAMTDNEVSRVISALTPGQKYTCEQTISKFYLSKSLK